MHDFWLTHVSVWLSGACFGLALAGRLRADPQRQAGPAWSCRLWWLGCGLLWAHVIAVWILIHHGVWSAAWEHTAQATFRATGVDTGTGIWFNFLTLAIWTIDCFVQCVQPANEPRKEPLDGQADPLSPEIPPTFRNGPLHSLTSVLAESVPPSSVFIKRRRMWNRGASVYLAGMWFQAAVVFATGWTRWVGWGMTLGLIAAAVLPKSDEPERMEAGER